MHTRHQHSSKSKPPEASVAMSRTFAPSPFDLGWDACEQGKSLASNPYKSYTVDAQEWLDGFQTATNRRHLLHAHY